MRKVSFIVGFFIVVCLMAVGSLGFAATGNFEVSGIQVLDEECQATSVTITGTVTGDTDDGDGYDVVLFVLWDDGEVKDSQEIRVKVGETQHVSVTLSFNSLYGTSAPGVGISVYDHDDRSDEIFGLDPFYPEDVSGRCSGTVSLSVSVVGEGKVVSDPAGISCGEDCSENYDMHTSVTLTAIPESGSEFVGWEGACSGSSPTCRLYMDSDKSVVAKFKKASGCVDRYDEGFEAGKEWCRTHPSECGIPSTGADCASTFDFVTNTLKIPNFENQYWLELEVKSWNPVTLELKSYGIIGTK